MNIKTFKTLSRRLSCAALSLLATITLLSACSSDYEAIPAPYYPEATTPCAVVTVKHAADSTVYLQLDDSTTLYPQNLENRIFGGKEVRAFVYYNETKPNNSPYTYSVIVQHIDSILTKQTVETLGTRNDSVYGNDDIEIQSGFPTVCEDNYLTLFVTARWGRTDKKHLINLVRGTNPDDPYELELRHNAYGDTNGQQASSTVAFSLKALPKTGGKTVKLKVKYSSAGTRRTVEFDYRTKD